jgi:hypothetical protein
MSTWGKGKLKSIILLVLMLSLSGDDKQKQAADLDPAIWQVYSQALMPLFSSQNLVTFWNGLFGMRVNTFKDTQRFWMVLAGWVEDYPLRIDFNNTAKLESASDFEPVQSRLEKVFNAIDDMGDFQDESISGDIGGIGGSATIGLDVATWTKESWVHLGFNVFEAGTVLASMSITRSFSRIFEEPPSVDPCSRFTDLTTVVNVEFEVSELRSIVEASYDFELDLTVKLQWQDDRLAWMPAIQPGDERCQNVCRGTLVEKCCDGIWQPTFGYPNGLVSNGAIEEHALGSTPQGIVVEENPLTGVATVTRLFR